MKYLVCFILFFWGNVTAQPAPDKLIFKEFDGVSANGDWRKQYGWEYFPACDWNKWHFETTKNAGKMIVDGGYGECAREGNNQHVVRYDKLIDASKPYTIECDFTITPTFASLVNSFCINFNIQKGFSRDSMLNCWSINLDIHDKKTGAFTIKNMGFADSVYNEDAKQYESGRFAEMLPSLEGVGAKMQPAINHFKIEVNKRLDGSFVDKWVTITWTDASGLRAHFEQDYSKFPYQPNELQPVRVGLNTHGTNWVVKNLLVYYN